MTTGIEERVIVEHPVVADEPTACLLNRFEGSPYHWRIALDADIDPFQTNIFWVQEPHFRERLQSCHGGSVIYAASPATLYDWGDANGGYVWNVSHSFYEHWEPLPAEALPRERSRSVWLWMHSFTNYYADFTLTSDASGALVLREAHHRRRYAYVVEVERVLHSDPQASARLQSV